MLMIVALLASAIILSATITLIYSRSGKGGFLSFLVTLKNLLVGVLVASCIMLFSILLKSDLIQIGRELDRLAMDVLDKFGIYFQGTIVGAALLGSFVSFLVTKILLLIETIIGSIGEKKHIPSEASSFSSTMVSIIKSPFQVVLNILLALVISILIASIMELIGMGIAASLKAQLNVEVSLVVGAWLSAFISYLIARLRSKARKLLETES